MPGVDVNLPFENPGCMSVEDGTLVFDGCMRLNPITGDLVGLGSAVLDGEIDLATGNGETEGRITFGTDATPACLANGDCGIFVDEFKGDVIGGRFFGKFEIEGISGDVEGVKIKGTDVETGPGTLIFILDGTIRFPN